MALSSAIGVVLMGLAVVGMQLTAAFSHRSIAQSGAEAAALAGSMGGLSAAERAAAANGGRLELHQGSIGDFTATVVFKNSRFTARAQGT